MRYVDEFRDGSSAQAILREIAGVVEDRPFTFMEVCGTHTMSIYRYGIKSVLPPSLRLVSGPGCPVCVTSVGYVDRALALALRPNIIVATFGDMVRVPGSKGSLEKARSAGARVEITYSVIDALRLAERHPSEQVVFLGVGFETTAPTVASAIIQAQGSGWNNFSVLCAHKVIPPAMSALVLGPMNIDGFLCPAHVSAIIGTQPYRFLAEEHGIPCVIAGFEPLDILQGVLMLARQCAKREARVENQYARIVKPEGNRKAKAIMAEVFEPCDAAWRGLGIISGSGMRIRDAFQRFDAAEVFQVEEETGKEPAGCICGDVLRGIKEPRECGLFARQCTPTSPVGACMVSSEGSCAAAYKYGR